MANLQDILYKVSIRAVFGELAAESFVLSEAMQKRIRRGLGAQVLDDEDGCGEVRRQFPDQLVESLESAGRSPDDD